MVDVEVVGFIVRTENFRLRGEGLWVRVGRWGEVFKVRLWISKINKKIIYFLIHLDKADISPLLVFTIFYKLHLYLVILSKKKIT